MTKNVAASVSARLKKQARERGSAFQTDLTYFGLERFLYRLSISPHAGSFVLKGGLMLRVWGVEMTRPTKDIDFLAYTDNSISNVAGIFREVCEQHPPEDDGLIFDTDSLKATAIKEGSEHIGVRVTLMGFLVNSRIPMQIDVGFGDVITPEVRTSTFPASLNFPNAVLKMYPAEASIAEKLQAMIYLGRLNSRMKDFFDVWILSESLEFDGDDLVAAVRATFKNRSTEIERNPEALTNSFLADPQKQKQWRAFVKRAGLGCPSLLSELESPLRAFLIPLLRAASEEGSFRKRWKEGSWCEGEGC